MQRPNWGSLGHAYQVPITVMILGVVRNEEDLISLHFISYRLRVNTLYQEVLERVMKPCIDNVGNREKDDFQQGPAPSHKAKRTDAC